LLTNNVEILKKALERERKAREIAESFVENRLRELYDSNIILSNEVLTQEEFQNDLLDNLVDALFVIGLKGEILKINKEGIKLLGLEDDFQLSNISQFSNRNKKDIFRLLSNDHLLNEDGIYNYEFINVKREKKYVNIKSKTLVDTDKKPYAYQAIVRDVTANYFVELKLRKQKELENFESQILKDLLKSNDIFTNAFDLVNHIADYLNTDDCVFYGFLDGELVQLATTKNKLDANQFIKNKLSIPLDKGVIGRVARTKKGEIVNDTSKDKDYIVDDMSRFSEITVPVLLNGEIVGVIDSEHPAKNYYTSDQLDALSKISILISLHIKNSATELDKNLKQTELEIAKNRLQVIFESSSHAKIIESKEGYIEFISNSFLNLFNIPLNSMEKFVGLSCELARHSFKRYFLHENEFVDGVEKIIKKSVALNDELLELKDGRYLSRNYTPIIHNGKLDGHIWTYRDVTLQINYDKSIEFQNKKYKSIIDNINLGLMEVDTDDVILAVNDAFCNMSGYDSKELKGKKAKDILLKKSDLEIIEEKNRIRKSGVDDTFEIEIITKSGESKFWLISGAPNYNINGEVIGSVGIHLDITEIKNLYNENTKLIEDLKESNLELSSYAHIVSHDLRTPLHNIASCIDWLKEDNEDKLSKDSLEYISIITDSIIDMNNLISSTLQFSELRSAVKENDLSNSQAIVDNIIANIFLNKDKRISVNVLKPLPVIKLNSTKTKQIFQNLIENAYKYKDCQKDSFININWQDQNDSILFIIEDNGIGIAENHFSIIFNAFKKLNNRTDSSGIGLSIVKKIIENTGGKIWFDSKLNVGTTFYFTLPK
jgi:two-component system, sporulation sensor kinase E